MVQKRFTDLLILGLQVTNDLGISITPIPGLSTLDTDALTCVSHSGKEEQNQSNTQAPALTLALSATPKGHNKKVLLLPALSGRSIGKLPSFCLGCFTGVATSKD